MRKQQNNYAQYDKAVIVTGDGDFHCLVNYFLQSNKLARLIVPNRYKYSLLLRNTVGLGRRITFMNDLKVRLVYKKHLNG